MRIISALLLASVCVAWCFREQFSQVPLAEGEEIYSEFSEMFLVTGDQEAEETAMAAPILTPEDIANEDGTLKLTPDFNKVSQAFFISHMPTNKVFHPATGTSNPADGTRIVVHGSKPGHALWQWIPLKDYPGYGVIRHRDSKAYLRPEGGSAAPGSGTYVVVNRELRFACVFTIAEDLKAIKHYGGLNMWPVGKVIQPEDHTRIQLFANTGAASNFNTLDTSLNVLDVHAAKISGGSWEMVFSVFEPKAQFTKSIKYKQGFSSTQSQSMEAGIEASMGVKFFGISSSIKYNMKFGIASSQTWKAEQEDSIGWTIYPGPSVCIYQYKFKGQYDTVGLQFGSDIFASTDCNKSPAQIWNN